MPAAPDDRSRSPHLTAFAAPLPKGHPVQFFHAVDPAQQGALLVQRTSKADVAAGAVPLLQSHGWLDGVLQAAFDPASLDPSNASTYPLVLPRSDLRFVTRDGRNQQMQPRRVRYVREVTAASPLLLSLVFVRWGGQYSKWMDSQERNDGDWGDYGSPPSDEYMTALVQKGVLAHPQLCADSGLNIELLCLFVSYSQEVRQVGSAASKLAKVLKGQRKCFFWMLWPAEWLDSGDPDFACYIERQELFATMRMCEAVGLRTGFPHPADQFELITSKSWMATLCLDPKVRLPKGTLVTKESVMIDPLGAAKTALRTLEHLRCLCPFPVDIDEPPAPSVVNKDGVTKGVVKLGWSWENRFVLSFGNLQQLKARLAEILTLDGCTASACLVQEWVDFDFEMRLYMIPPGDWEVGDEVEPTRIECNAWGPHDGSEKPGTCGATFSKLSHEACLARWAQDTVAWESAKQQAKECAQHLLAWLRCANAQPVPFIRLDFMLKRLAPGKARVYFGEFCEMGACCLGWQDGPPTIWRAALDAVLR